MSKKKSIEEEAVAIVADAVSMITEDDLWEHFDVDPADLTDDMKAAGALADELAEAIRATPDAILALVGRALPPTTPKETPTDG